MHACVEAGPTTRLREWKYGWPSVLAGFVGFGVSMLYFYSLGVMVAPIGAETGWSRAEVTAGPALVAISNFLLAAPVGHLVARVGIRRVAIPGYTAYCLSLAALGMVGSNVLSWLALWAVLGVCYVFTGGSIWALGIASKFDRSRGLALSISLCGTGLVGAVAPLIGAALLPGLGWRLTYMALGGGMLVFGLPLLWLCLRNSDKPAPSQPSRPEAVDPITAPALTGLDFSQAIAGRAFWIFAASALIVGTSFGALLVHFIPLIVARGIGVETAAGAAGLIGLTAIFGRLGTGMLLDRFSGKLVGTILFAMPVLAVLLLWSAPAGIVTVNAAAIILGLSVGAEYDVLAVLVSRHVGMRSYAAIYGQIVATFGIGTGFGPALAGIYFDAWGDYDLMLQVMTAALLIPPVLLLMLPRQPEWPSVILPSRARRDGQQQIKNTKGGLNEHQS